MSEDKSPGDPAPEWGGVKQIDCKHCDGNGKCSCYTCAAKFESTGGFNRDVYAKYIKENPDLMGDCGKCNGYGFVLLINDGTIIKPHEKEEE